jgi:ribonucleoside-triphosphate reductase
MLVHHSFDPRFITVIERLKKQYGEEMFNLEGIGEQALDINRYSKTFFSDNKTAADKTIDDNSNVDDVSVVTWEKEGSKPIYKLNSLYMMWKSSMNKYGIKRANKLLEAEIAGAIRIHDLHKWCFPYCYAGSLTPLVQDGMPFYNKIKIGAVQHFDSFIDLSLQYICYMSNQIAGAAALPNFFIYADYFIRKDDGEEWYNDEKVLARVRQRFQSFIYSVNFNWRSNQSPFTNLSIFDIHWLNALFADHVNPDFSGPDFDNVDRLQRIFVEEMVKNLKDNPFTFPVMTAAMLYDEENGVIKDEEFFDWISEVSCDTGLFNFYVDSDTASLSSCCRLRNNLQEASREYTNSFGVGGLDVGSHRVVTINLPQIAHLSEDWESFTRLLEYRVNMTHDILDVHRDTMQTLIDTGRLPLYKYKFMFLNKQFSTVGFIGMYEALEIMGFDITDKKGYERAHGVLDIINHMNEKRAQSTGHLYNLEQIPGESAAYGFARKDSLQFEDASYEIYSNQYIPLVKEVDIADRIVAQGRFDKSVGGGSILHINVDEPITKKQIKKLIKFTAKKGVVYFAINLSLSRCTSCGKVYIGRLDKSPCHNADIDRFIRVVGYLTPVKTWSEARRTEYKDRQMYGSDVF